jgi:DinB family
MTAKDLQTLFDYNYWANGKLFDVISQLTPDQFTQPVSGSYGSVRNTLVHMMSRSGAGLTPPVVHHVARASMPLTSPPLPP